MLIRRSAGFRKCVFPMLCGVTNFDVVKYGMISLVQCILDSD